MKVVITTIVLLCIVIGLTILAIIAQKHKEKIFNEDNP